MYDQVFLTNALKCIVYHSVCAAPICRFPGQLDGLRMQPPRVQLLDSLGEGGAHPHMVSDRARLSIVADYVVTL